MNRIVHNRIKAEGVTDRFGQQPRWLRGVDLFPSVPFILRKLLIPQVA